MVACLLINFKNWSQVQSIVQFPKALTQINELLILPELPNCLCLHLEVNEKTAIWQVALNLEVENVVTGYGFGKDFNEAKTEAVSVLFRRINKQSIHS